MNWNDMQEAMEGKGLEFNMNRPTYRGGTDAENDLEAQQRAKWSMLFNIMGKDYDENLLNRLIGKGIGLGTTQPEQPRPPRPEFPSFGLQTMGPDEDRWTMIQHILESMRD